MVFVVSVLHNFIKGAIKKIFYEFLKMRFSLSKNLLALKTVYDNHMRSSTFKNATF